MESDVRVDIEAERELRKQAILRMQEKVCSQSSMLHPLYPPLFHSLSAPYPLSPSLLPDQHQCTPVFV